jgi:hypothetical protein
VLVNSWLIERAADIKDQTGELREPSVRTLSKSREKRRLGPISTPVGIHEVSSVAFAISPNST